MLGFVMAFMLGSALVISGGVMLGTRGSSDAATGPVNAHFVKIEGGSASSLAIDINGNLWAWGANSNGQLGDGTTTNRNIPVLINDDGNWKDVSMGNDFSIGLREDGTLWTWGNNVEGRTGLGLTAGNTLVPTRVGEGNNWTHVSGGAAHAIALRGSGELWAWGLGTHGRLGNGGTAVVSAPIRIGGHADWTIISAGQTTSFGIRAEGLLYGWGQHTSGATGNFNLGLPDGANRTVPTRIGARTDWASVSGRGNGGNALTTDGYMYGWGNNAGGAIGDGTTTRRQTPFRAQGSWTSICTRNEDASIGIRDDGTLWAWPVHLAWPMDVIQRQFGMEDNWIYASTGRNVRWFAINDLGETWAWGARTSGGLGDGLASGNVFAANGGVLIAAPQAPEPEQLPTPEDIEIDVTDNTVSWNTVENATGFRIYVGYDPVATVPVVQTYFEFTAALIDYLGLGYGTHLIRVIAIGDDDLWLDSEPVTVELYVPTPPNYTSLLAPTYITLDGYGMLSWNNPNAVSFGYGIYINGNLVATAGENYDEFDISEFLESLDVGTHYIRVRALGDLDHATDRYIQSGLSTDYAIYIVQEEDNGNNNGGGNDDNGYYGQEPDDSTPVLEWVFIAIGIALVVGALGILAVVMIRKRKKNIAS